MYRAVFLVLCGPDELGPLSETLASIEHFEGEEVKTIVVEDATRNARWPHVAARHPTVDVLRAPWPTAGPPRLSPLIARGLTAALERYDFEVLCKLDTDALLCGHGLTACAADAFAADPLAGMLGTVGMRHDGVPEDYSHSRWVLHHERRWSRRVREIHRRATAGTFAGEHVHGGVYLVSRPALDAVAAAGDLARLPPWWSQIGEDLWLSLAVCAAGYELRSWGAPGQPTACGSRFLPLALDRVGPDGVLAVHSVRRGAAGEREAEVREFFRRRLEECCGSAGARTASGAAGG